MKLVRAALAAAAALMWSGGAWAAVEFANLVDPAAPVEKIAHGFRFTEGPVWSAHGTLLFSDIPADTIYEWVPGPVARRNHNGLPASLYGSLKVFRRPSGQANGLAFDAQGRLVECEHDRRISRTNADGSVVTLQDRFEGKRLNSPNDLAVKSDGSIYFTDPPYGLPDASQRELDFSGIYRIGKDGRPAGVDKSVPFPNGLAFSPDERKLYVVDSEANKILVFEVAANGALGASKLFADVVLKGSHEGPDGLKVDDQGNVFCAGPDGVWVFAPDGRFLGKILLPEVPSNLAFGDADRSTLYVTARTGLYRVRLKTSGHGRIGSGL